MKYFISILITAAVVGLGVTAYFKGWLPTVSFQKPQAASITNTEVAPAIPSPTPKTFTTVTAGGILVFKQYSVDIPNDWQYSKDGSVPGQVDRLTLTNGVYKIVFDQAAMGGGGCVYPGEPSGPMATEFVSFTDITSATGEKLRLGVSSDGNAAVCESQSSAWGDLTEFGRIGVTYPANPDQSIVSEVITIISSIKKISITKPNNNQIILDAVKAALVAKHGSDFSSLTYSISKVEGNYASGSVGGTGGGGMWFAAKVGNDWKIVSDGNGSTDCADLKPYPSFPTDMIPECWDSSANKLVTR